MRAARVLALILVVGAAGTAAADDAAAKVGALARTVETDPSEKARIAAVVALARLGDGRAFEPLLRALRDPSPLVRGVAATALGYGGDLRAAPALTKALDDPDAGVAARARSALAQLRGPTAAVPAARPVPTRVQIAPREPPRRGPLHVRVNAMAMKGPATRTLSGRMRELVARQIASDPGVQVDFEGDGELVVDGSITRLTHEAQGPWIETTCEVKLTVSSAGGNILSIVSGGATVQTPRGGWNKRLEENLQAEALDNAVRGLQVNLLALLNRHGGR